MVSIPNELSLDLKLAYVPKSIGDVLRDVSMTKDKFGRKLKIDDVVKRLEDEMRKIDAFKRELPLCMLLLNDAIQALKEESMNSRGSNAQPVLEEFIPLKGDSDNDDGDGGGKEKDSKDKRNWMSSVQLWSSDAKPKSAPEIKEACKSRTEARAFMPFQFPATALRMEDKVVHGLSLLTPATNKPSRLELGQNLCTKASANARTGVSVSPTASSVQSNLRMAPQQPTSRKQRRCWSPELHRQFVNALQQLGGSEAATPKQIRELMQVDGLTNDEVKSHLQKYRLHTKRIPAAAAPSPSNQQLVLFASHDQYGDSAKPSSSQSGSPQGPLHLSGNAGGTSTTGVDSMEDDDSESHGSSWKADIARPSNDV
ncbi:SANT/Myb domain [Dillenia turbinata]|uniref:SANT/Myb domain n=1 Tax=Dillenia turbinata TaxID=194707 RepID=A0AAN8YXA5_9MAGN